MRTWKPDTCECHIEELYNGSQIVGHGQILHKCPEHAGVPDNELYGVIYSNPDGENKRKNLAMATLLGMDGADFGLHQVVTDREGRQRPDFKDGVKVDWSWTGTDSNRKLVMNVTGATLSVAQKNSFRGICNGKFGVDKVDIN